MSEWIKCSDRLPEEDSEVLVYSPDYDGMFFVAVWHPSVNEWHHCSGVAWPSHWQLLIKPEAP